MISLSTLCRPGAQHHRSSAAPALGPIPFAWPTRQPGLAHFARSIRLGQFGSFRPATVPQALWPSIFVTALENQPCGPGSRLLPPASALRSRILAHWAQPTWPDPFGVVHSAHLARFTRSTSLDLPRLARRFGPLWLGQIDPHGSAPMARPPRLVNGSANIARSTQLDPLGLCPLSPVVPHLGHALRPTPCSPASRPLPLSPLASPLSRLPSPLFICRKVTTQLRMCTAGTAEAA